MGEVFPARVLRSVAAIALGQVGYCALFGFLGLFIRRSLIFGVGYIVLIEGIMASIEFVARKLTVAYYVRSLFLHWLQPADEKLQQWQNDWGMELTTIPSARECVTTIGVFAVVVTLLTALWFARAEFRVKTPGDG